MENQRGVCVEINGIFYESCSKASRVFGCNDSTIKRRCLSDNFSNYKVFKIPDGQKWCPACSKNRPISEFGNSSTRKDGLECYCNSCRKTYNQEHKKEKKQYNKQYNIDNKKSISIQKRQYNQNNKEQRNAGQRKKYKTDVIYKINKIIGKLINKSLRGNKNNAHWEDLVGWTVEEGRAHLESLFTEGMTWENYGGGKYDWSLDHIIAVSKWNITSAECHRFKNCWALDNLQPLWHIRNMEKGDRPMEPKYLVKPF